MIYAENVEVSIFNHLIEFALGKLKENGVDAAEISLGQTSGFSVSARLGDVETLEHHLDKNFHVTVFQNHCTGAASSSDFSFDSIKTTIEKAMTIARYANPDPFSGLADSARFARVIPNCDLYHPWSISTTEAIQMAIACEKQALAVDKRIANSEGVSISSIESVYAYANTSGFLGDFKTSEHAISCSLIANENGQMQREDEYTVARNANDLLSLEMVAKSAAKKTVGRLGGRKIKTQTCSVIFDAPMARSLLRSFVQAISGGSLYRQSSFLLNALGKPVFPAFIDIFQQPHLLSAMGSMPFDGEGVATTDQHYVRQGELTRYVLSSYSARKLGMETTGNAGGVFNLSISHSDLSLPQLLKKMHRGLFVTDLMGQGVNITTGDYSRGAAGFWVENGEIQFPVEEITIAGNLKSMLADIVAVANDIDVRGSIRTGSILINQMTIAGE